MQVRTFTGASSQEILARIKAEMGPEAVIIGNRTFKKNGEICHEITAGIDRNPVSAQQPVGTMPGDGMPSGWSDWHKDWLQIKEQIFALMRPAIQMDRLTPRPRVAREYLQREGISDAVAGDLDTHLVLTPLLSGLQMDHFLERYRTEGAASIIWTHLDEAASYGSLVNVARATGLPVSGLSYGSELKESLAPATEPLIWRLIFKRQLPGEPAGNATSTPQPGA